MKFLRYRDIVLTMWEYVECFFLSHYYRQLINSNYVKLPGVAFCDELPLNKPSPTFTFTDANKFLEGYTTGKSITLWVMQIVYFEFCHIFCVDVKITIYRLGIR